MYLSAKQSQKLVRATFGRFKSSSFILLAQPQNLLAFKARSYTTAFNFAQRQSSLLNVNRRCFAGTDLPSHMKLEMPNLSPTMEKGNIAKWMKKEGDEIKPGDILAQIETDKATVDFEMQEEGFIAKLLYPEGSKDVKLG